ncbi:hypothetical protein NXW72_09315 [Bacteroides fragilis]|nr:hypothetical protein [Bacteroides fragilis]
MEKEKAGEEKVHIIILYRGNLSGRGKRGDCCEREGKEMQKGGEFTEKGRKRGISGKRKGCFGEGKEAFRGGKSRRELGSGER